MTLENRFAVVYRWRLKDGKEEQFRRAWEVVTRELLETAGSLGSRLHRAEDGTWLAYAQWPSRDAWATARVSSATGESALAQMTDAIDVRFDPVLLEPVTDLLLSTASKPLFHMASVRDWAAPGDLYRPSGFDEESFIHCATREQLAHVTPRFAGRSDVLLLVIDPARVAAEIRYENLEGGAELYPHLYGPLERAAVIAVERLAS